MHGREICALGELAEKLGKWYNASRAVIGWYDEDRAAVYPAISLLCYAGEDEPAGRVVISPAGSVSRSVEPGGLGTLLTGHVVSEDLLFELKDWAVQDYRWSW